MYPYMTCACGKTLGDIYFAFVALRNLKFETAYKKLKYVDEDGAKLEINPSIIALSESIDFDLGEELDMIGLKHMCCRPKMMSQVPMSSLT